MKVDEQGLARAAQIQWDTRPEIRAEFGSFEVFAAYEKASARGAAKVFHGRVISASAPPRIDALDAIKLYMPAQASMPAQITLSGIGQGVIEGYASVVGVINRKNFKIAPGAFRDVASKVPLPILWAHDWRQPIGRWDVLREDARGLFARGTLNMNVDAGRTAYEHLQHQDVTGLSIGFGLPPGSVKEIDGVMTVSLVDLHEISVVAVPADDLARVLPTK